MMSKDPRSVSERLQDLFFQSQSHVLGEQIASKIGPGTLLRSDLQFLGSFMAGFSPRRVIEFGSGLSTLCMVDQIAVQPQARIYTLDHSRYYLERTKAICQYSIQVEFWLSRLHLYPFKGKGFVTYAPGYLKRIPKETCFDLVLIDGPSGRMFGREAPLYQIIPWITSKTLIFLHDSHREPEQEALSNWSRVWPGRLKILFQDPEKAGFVVFAIEDPFRMIKRPFGVWEIAASWYLSLRRYFSRVLLNSTANKNP